jgi:hypothetical protein
MLASLTVQNSLEYMRRGAHQSLGVFTMFLYCGLESVMSELTHSLFL